MKNILEYLENAAERRPDKQAFCDENVSLTFRQVLQQAQSVGTCLLGRSVRRAPVAVLLERSPACLTAAFGAVYAGCCYVLLDVHAPEERSAAILRTLSPAAVITDEAHEAAAERLCPSVPVLLLAEALPCPADRGALERVRRESIDTDPVYILFTSGSTGVPKGAVVCHRSIIAYAEWAGREFRFNEETVFGNQTPFCFSMSVLDIFSTLRSSASLYIIPKSLFAFPVRLIESLKAHAVNTVYWVPSAMALLANCRAFDYTPPPALQTVLFAGEVMPANVMRYWKAHLPGALFANLYGPTEVTDICTCYKIGRDFSNGEPIPIGTACDNCGILLETPDGREAGPGEEGEILVRGSFLSLGYYNDPEKTARAFVQNPLNPRYPETVYRTGDLAKYNERGELVYLGRRDLQIKHMGYRIELGEVEAAAGEVEGVACCAAFYRPETDRICLFYQSASVGDNVLSRELRRKLPGYMLPAELFRLERIPYNANGKIDRALLKKTHLAD